jgi:hypothetical protein
LKNILKFGRKYTKKFVPVSKLPKDAQSKSELQHNFVDFPANTRQGQLWGKKRPGKNAFFTLKKSFFN